MLAHQIPKRVLVHFNSRTVVMEFEILNGVCNNPPAEWTSSEKWMALKRVTDTPSLLLRDAAMSTRAWWFALKLLA